MLNAALTISFPSRASKVTLSIEPTESEAPIRTITTIGTVRTKAFSTTILAAASWIFKVPEEFFQPLDNNESQQSSLEKQMREQLLSIIQSHSHLLFGMLSDKKVSLKVAPSDLLWGLKVQDRSMVIPRFTMRISWSVIDEFGLKQKEDWDHPDIWLTGSSGFLNISEYHHHGCKRILLLLNKVSSGKHLQKEQDWYKSRTLWNTMNNLLIWTSLFPSDLLQSLDLDTLINFINGNMSVKVD